VFFAQCGPGWGSVKSILCFSVKFGATETNGSQTYVKYVCPSWTLQYIQKSIIVAIIQGFSVQFYLFWRLITSMNCQTFFLEKDMAVFDSFSFFFFMPLFSTKCLCVCKWYRPNNSVSVTVCFPKLYACLFQSEQKNCGTPHLYLITNMYLITDSPPACQRTEVSVSVGLGSWMVDKWTSIFLTWCGSETCQ